MVLDIDSRFLDDDVAVSHLAVAICANVVDLTLG
jgi:hypothetical protein